MTRPGMTGPADTRPAETGPGETGPGETRPAAPRPVIQVRDYHKAYGETVAVHGLSFELLPGQILGMLGPNGAGKTTTMRALAGIIPPTRGHLVVDGHDVVADPVPARKALAYVPDEPRLFESLTVEEHLFLTARIYGVHGHEERIDRLFEAFDLVAHREKLAGELSRGMRQKVAICCAYLHEPRAILFDEPLTGLDPRAIRALKASIRERAEAGVGVVVSSHLLDLVEDLSTHLLVLHEGRALFMGPTSEARRAIARRDIAGRGVEGRDIEGRGVEGRGSEETAEDATLEEVFLALTDPGAKPLAPGAGGRG